MKYTKLIVLSILSVSLQSQANDISGVWNSSDYECPAGIQHIEKFKIVKNEDVYTAIKLVGDACVPAGFVTFVWDSNRNNCRIFGGQASDPASVIGECSVSIENEENFVVFPDATILENRLEFKKDSYASSLLMPTEVLSNLDIHIPSASYKSQEGLLDIWVDLEYKNIDSNGKLLWQLKDYGVNK